MQPWPLAGAYFATVLLIISASSFYLLPDGRKIAGAFFAFALLLLGWSARSTQMRAGANAQHVVVVYVSYGVDSITEAALSALTICETTPTASVILLTLAHARTEADGGAHVEFARERLRGVCPQHTLLPTGAGDDAFCAAHNSSLRAPLQQPALLVRSVAMSSVWAHWARAGVRGHRFDAVGGGRFAKPILGAAGGPLPPCVPRALVLDTDVLASRDVRPLWAASFGSFGPRQVLMAKRLWAHEHAWSGLAHAAACVRHVSSHALNSGVLALDLRRMRASRWSEHVMATVSRSVSASRSRPPLSEHADGAGVCGLASRNGTLCVGDQLVLSVACALRPAACANALDAAEHAEYCVRDEFGKAARRAGCRTRVLGGGEGKNGAFYACSRLGAWLTGSHAPTLFHYNCRERTPLARVGAPNARVQASIDRFYALSRARGWETAGLDRGRGGQTADVGECARGRARAPSTQWS
jgi:hypothetical protein